MHHFFASLQIFVGQLVTKLTVITLFLQKKKKNTFLNPNHWLIIEACGVHEGLSRYEKRNCYFHLAKGKHFKRRFSLGQDGLLWLTEYRSEVYCSHGCKFDLLCNHISGSHLSAVPQLCHHLRFYTKHSEGSFGFRTNTQNERLLGFQISLEKAGSVFTLSRSSNLSLEQILLNEAGLIVVKNSERCASKYPLIWFHNLFIIWS